MPYIYNYIYIYMKWKIANSCLKPPEIKIHEDSHGNSHLVGGIPTSLKNGGVRQLGWLFHSQYDGKVIIHSMVPVTTNQIIIIFPLLLVYSLSTTINHYPKFPWEVP